MIRKFLSGSLLSLALAASGAAAELNIAVLDTQRALLNSEEAQQILKGARDDLEQDQQQIRELAAEIGTLQEKLQQDAEVMSPTESRRRQKEIEDKRMDYQFRANRLQKDIQDRQQELLQQMAPKIDAVLKDLIEEEGYDVIMERGSLLYADSRHDITRKVTEELNERREKQR